ncbi:MAG: hypothetical protein QME21_04565 [Anaerolineales bacterium]|nr:hypothetical protein [Anaerolineales bacterium]
MSVNIACSAPGCTNPVIGQCTGYEKACGKYYCREHSIDTLCIECANRKSADEQAEKIYQEYLNAAEKIEQESLSVFNGKVVYKKGVKIFALLGLIVGIFVVLITAPPNEVGILLLQEVFGGPIQGIIIWSLCFPLVWIVGVVVRSIWLGTQGHQKAVQVDKSMPGFLKFYEAWRSEKRKEKLMGVLATAGTIAAIAIAAGVSETDYDRTRRAVRDELNSRNL